MRFSFCPVILNLVGWKFFYHYLGSISITSTSHSSLSFKTKEKVGDWSFTCKNNEHYPKKKGGGAPRHTTSPDSKCTCINSFSDLNSYASPSDAIITPHTYPPPASLMHGSCQSPQSFTHGYESQLHAYTPHDMQVLSRNSNRPVVRYLYHSLSI